MSAVGFVLIGFGVLTIWAGVDQVIVFDVLRSFIGAPTTPRTAEGAAMIEHTPSHQGQWQTPPAPAAP